MLFIVNQRSSVCPFTSHAAEIISASLEKAGAGLIELRRIEASKDIAGTLAQAKNVTYLPNQKGNNMLLNIPV